MDLGGGVIMSHGDLLTLLCALLFAGQITATGIFAEKIDFRVLVFLQLLVSALLSFIVFMATDRNFIAMTQPNAILTLLYLGIFSTFVCYLLQTKAQTRVSSSTSAILLSTECLFGAFFSVLVGFDQLSIRLFVGGLIIFASIILPDVYLKHKERKSADGKVRAAKKV